MKSFFGWSVMLLLGCLIAFIGCGDDDDDDDNDDLGGDDDINQDAANSCEETPTILSGIDEASDLLGISGADLLAETGGGFTTTAQYGEDTSILTQSPAGGQTDLTVTIAYDGGEVREIESVPVDDGSMNEMITECRHRLEMEVTINFATADGAFAETWSAVLSMAVAQDENGFDAPLLVAGFDPYDLAGDFEIVSIEGPAPDSVDGVLYTTAAAPAAGSVNILVEQSSGTGDDGTVSQANQVALSWGETEY